MTNARYTIIRGGLVQANAHSPAEYLDILVKDGQIEAMLPPGKPAPPEATLISAEDCYLIPGLVNAHTHAHGALGKGLIPDNSPLEILLTLLPAITGHFQSDLHYAIAQLSACEMIRKGCTTCMDMYSEFPAPTEAGIYSVARGYQDTGMRAVVSPMVADKTLYQAYPAMLEQMPEPLRDRVQQYQTSPADVTLSQLEKILGNWPFDPKRIRPGLGPTIPMHCSDYFLRRCTKLSEHYQCPMQTHLAESKTQAVQSQRRYGCSLTEHLSSLGMLNANLSVAHAIWLDDRDIELLADADVSVVHNPLSNLRLGSGIAPVAHMLRRGVNVGIGTDAANTSDTQNMFEASRLAGYLTRIMDADHNRWLTAADAFHAATVGSAKAIGFAGQVGELKPGYAADIVFLDLDQPEYWPLRNPLQQVVNGESGAAIRSVIIDGKLVLKDREILTADTKALRQTIAAAAEEVDALSEEKRKLAEQIAQHVGEFCIANRCTHHTVHRVLDEHHTPNHRDTE